MGGGGGWEEKWGLKLTSAKVEVEVEAELGNDIFKDIFEVSDHPLWMVTNIFR